MIVNYLKEALVLFVWIALAIQVSYLLWKPTWVWEEIAEWLRQEH